MLLSRIEAGRIATASVSVDLAEVAREVVAELRLEPRTEFAADGVPIVAADSAHLHQILLNFLANAVAYGEPPFAIAIDEEAATVTVRVCDSGLGVPEAFIPHLFEAYSRASEHHEECYQGSGLGLAIAKGLAEAAGGEVWYEPGDAGGARFCLRLPKAERE